MPLVDGEKINAILPIKEFDDDHNIFMATEKGIVKKVALSAFSKPRASGIIAVDLLEGDRLVAVDITDGTHDVMMFSDAGKAIRFNEADVRPMGRTARGVRGIKLDDDHKVISALVIKNDNEILTATEKGFGKRTSQAEYSTIGRGGKGVVSIKVTERNGKVVSAAQVGGDDEVMLISDKGTLVRIRVAEISVIGRNTQGVRLINVADAENLIGLALVAVEGIDDVETTGEVEQPQVASDEAESNDI